MIATISLQLNSDYVQAAYDLQPMYGRVFLDFVVGWIMVVIYYLCLGRRTVSDRLILRITGNPTHKTLKPKQAQSDYG